MNSAGAGNVDAIAVFGVAGAILGAIFPIFGTNTVIVGLFAGIIIGFLIQRG